MKKRADKNKDLREKETKDEALMEDGFVKGGISEEADTASEDASSDSSDKPKEDDRYAYEDGEFNPDVWDDSSTTKRRRFFQNGMGLFVSIIALILFAALFVVEFRSYTKVKKGDNIYISQENKDDVEKKDETILEIIETGTNYTIYLDNDTGVEYVMFRVGSSITIQPLINPDGSYKKHIEPPTAAVKATEAATKHKWTDNLKIPGSVKETTAPAATTKASGTTQPAAVSP